MDSEVSRSKKREGYRVGVFKDGQLKKLFKLKEGMGYLKHKSHKIRSNKPKRQCTKKQLEALARGRALRGQRADGGGSATSTRRRAPKPGSKEAHLYTDPKVQNRKRAEKNRKRRAKEMESRRHRSEDEYTSSGVDERAYSSSGED